MRKKSLVGMLPDKSAFVYLWKYLFQEVKLTPCRYAKIWDKKLMKPIKVRITIEELK